MAEILKNKINSLEVSRHFENYFNLESVEYVYDQNTFQTYVRDDNFNYAMVMSDDKVHLVNHKGQLYEKVNENVYYEITLDVDQVSKFIDFKTDKTEVVLSFRYMMGLEGDKKKYIQFANKITPFTNFENPFEYQDQIISLDLDNKDDMDFYKLLQKADAREYIEDFLGNSKY